ncbi:MAG: aldo/keto reductase [Labilithrix sp.]|nr:aldo/keto reductase [Labilithrix sp.]MBX3216795.1 aldo/keto reductase [Labilithrix sp.]
MRRRRFGPLEVDVPVIGLGTWQMEADDRESAVVAIRRAIDRGMTHIDTAELYGRGAVEDIVGEAIAGIRGEVFLASKVHPDQATYAGTLRACEKSLRRLRTDRLDLYLLHWRGSQPLEETFRAFDALVQDGKIRAWGVSNFDIADLERALEIAGEGVIACNQVLYNLQERDAEHLLQVFCERHRIAFVGYSPLGSGQFPRPGSFKGDALAGIASGHGVTARAVALAYLVRRPGTFTIPKTANASHVDELALARDLVLDPEEIATLESIFPLAPPKSEIPYV